MKPNNPYFSFIDTADYYFFASYVSGATVLNNGNIFVSDGPIGRAFEINSQSEKCWEYINPLSNNVVLNQGQNANNNPVFRFEFYETNYQAFSNKTLIAGAVIEKNALNPLLCNKNVSLNKLNLPAKTFSFYPNPSNSKIQIILEIKSISEQIILFNLQGQIVLQTNIQNTETIIDLSGFSKGVYLLKIGNQMEKVVLN